MTETDNLNELLTLDDVAGMLKCTRRQLLELTRRRGQRRKLPIPVIRINARMLRIRPGDLIEWLQQVKRWSLEGTHEQHAWAAPKGATPFTIEGIDMAVVNRLLRKLGKSASQTA